MNALKFPFLIFCTLLITPGCKKEPSASFTTDKSLYYAGETIQLNNQSSNGETYQWSFPDGSTANSKNATYTIDQYSTASSLQINLKVFTKNNRKTNQIFRTVAISRPVYISDYYAISSNGIYSPYKKTIDISNGVYKLTLVNKEVENNSMRLEISFTNNTRPEPGEYLIGTNVNLNLYLDHGQNNPVQTYAGTTGLSKKVVVTQTEDNTLKIRFSNIKLTGYTSGSIDPKYTASGDITF